MTARKKQLMRLQLADTLLRYAPIPADNTPRGGWIHAVRDALGMTQAQLAARLGITRQSVQDLEKSDAERRITLGSLDRAARAMNCRVVCAIVPQSGTLDDLRDRQAHAVASSMLETANHSMKLEAQGVANRERNRQRKLLAETILRESGRKLWQ
jgi:predicted DNA-binding mobile mystery protein A